ncbi:MAG: diguanylate cyclase domain-containing protein, partial [Geminicoccaceae bacterium]
MPRALVLGLSWVDGFKSINDAFGHAAGDELLRQAARRMTALLSPGDMLARLGGDEFLILPNLGSRPETVQALAEQVIENLGKPFALGNKETSSGVSIGIVFADHDRRDADRLLNDEHAPDNREAEYQAQKRKAERT